MSDNKHLLTYQKFVREQASSLSDKDKYKAIFPNPLPKDTVGSGGFAKVYHLTLHDENAAEIRYVVKQCETYNELKGIGIPTKYRYSKYSEYDYLRLMDHPNIIKVYDALELKDVLYMVYEYGGIELRTYIDDSRQNGKICISPDDLSQIFIKICSAVAYISNLDLVHSDLKIQNITLIPETKEPKVIDFGMMIFKNNGNHGKVGTRFFTPGVYKSAATEQSRFGISVKYESRRIKPDNFALGIILYYMFVGNIPTLDFYYKLNENRESGFQNCKRLLYNSVRNLNFKKEPIIDLIIDLIRGLNDIFEIESLKPFYMSFNDDDRLFVTCHELSIPDQIIKDQINELREKMTRMATQIQAGFRGMKNRKKTIEIKKIREAEKAQATLLAQQKERLREGKIQLEVMRTGKIITEPTLRNMESKGAITEDQLLEETERLLAQPVIQRFHNRKNNNTNTSNFIGKQRLDLPCQHPSCWAHFGFWTRRHHCRICLQPFCSDHIETYKKIIILSDRKVKNNQKICNSCFQKYTRLQLISNNDRYRPSFGGGKKKNIKKTKKVRKHQGIYQRGPKKGKLKPGFKYSGKKTKTGLKIIVKVKKVKKFNK